MYNLPSTEHNRNLLLHTAERMNEGKNNNNSFVSKVSKATKGQRASQISAAVCTVRPLGVTYDFHPSFNMVTRPIPSPPLEPTCQSSAWPQAIKALPVPPVTLPLTFHLQQINRWREFRVPVTAEVLERVLSVLYFCVSCRPGLPPSP